MGDLAHHGEGRALHVRIQISFVGERVETVARLVRIFSVSELLGAESFDAFPHGGATTFHHGLHSRSVGDIRVSRVVESKLHHE